jgi:hypothetical protein
MADVDRERVYRAEKVAYLGGRGKHPMSWTDLIELSNRVFDHPMWRSLYGSRPKVQKARVDALRSVAYITENRIRVARSQQDAWTLAHELAHLVAAKVDWRNGEGHGESFRNAQVTMVHLILGPEAADHLVRSFQSSGLSVNEQGLYRPMVPHQDGLFGDWFDENIDWITEGMLLNKP